MDRENSQVTIIIPTLNEIDGMKWFMPRLKKEWYDELIIIDGGSTDGTLEYCRENGYPVFIQSGKGHTNAYDEAFKKSTKDIIVMLTPDGNSIPEIIPQLVEKIKEGYDLAIASRHLGPAKSYDDDLFTGIGNKMFTTIINILFRAKYTDTLVGFRAFNRNAVYQMKLCAQGKRSLIARRFPIIVSWDPGSSIRAAKMKLKTCEVPGDEPKRIGGERKLSIIRGGFGLVFQILYEFITGPNF